MLDEANALNWLPELGGRTILVSVVGTITTLPRSTRSRIFLAQKHVLAFVDVNLYLLIIVSFIIFSLLQEFDKKASSTHTHTHAHTGLGLVCTRSTSLKYARRYGGRSAEN